MAEDRRWVICFHTLLHSFTRFSFIPWDDYTDIRGDLLIGKASTTVDGQCQIVGRMEIGECLTAKEFEEEVRLSLATANN